MHCFCYASGQIGFGTTLPKGTLPIATGPDKILRDFISGVARHAYDNETLLVPGIPEAPDQIAAVEALQRFCAWISKHPPAGVETMGNRAKKKRGLRR